MSGYDDRLADAILPLVRAQCPNRAITSHCPTCGTIADNAARAVAPLVDDARAEGYKQGYAERDALAKRVLHKTMEGYENERDRALARCRAAALADAHAALEALPAAAGCIHRREALDAVARLGKADA